MEWNEMEAGNNVVKFFHQSKANKNEFVLGGILRRGALAWLAEDSTLQIVSLKSGQIISSYTFSRSVYNCNVIVCVSEVIPSNNSHDVLLAICLDYIPNSAETALNHSSIAIYSVEHGCVLNCLKLEPYVTCMRFLPAKNCRRSLIQHFDGCLAVGTQEGLILVIDLYLNYLLDLHGEKQRQSLHTQITPNSCHIVKYNIPLVEIHRTYKSILRERSLQNVVHFGVKIEVIESPCTVETLLPVDLISGLAAGLEDGRLVIYDMSEMQIFYVSNEHELSPLIKMDFVEPPDDPRACFYILTLHGNEKKVVKCLFAFMYEKRLTDECGNIFFENFQYGAMKLEMLLESNASMAITCQAITKPPKNSDDDATCLFAISWNSMLNEETKLLVFDINQWYKEEMPRALSGDQAKSCLATFILKQHKYGLDAFLNPATISHFNSMQRCEEHFYPNSLSFDWLLLDVNSCCAYNWPGIQYKTLNILRASTASLFLEPNVIFEKICKARLLPQFTELNVNALFSQNAKYDVLLSVALEHNCMGLLRDCARSWADGSFTGNILPSSNIELSLQTLKNWIWKRASDIKIRCNELCNGLLTSGGHPLDHRERKELGFITRQLRSLADLYDEVLQQCSRRKPEKAKDGSLHLAADYQELLIWLINIGLLPETSRRFRSDDIPTTSNLASKIISIYPYKQLRDYYVQRRLAFAKIDECFISKKSGSCRLIFIDAFIEHECMQHASIAGTRNSDNLREHWLQNDGNGLYPPANIESMLRIMLLSSVNYESKCAILFYFFLDLHVALTDGDRHHGEDLKEIVKNFLQFPSVFKLSPSLTKTLQAFWHLDHGNIVAAVDEFLSPFNNNRQVEQWLIELLVDSLLLQNAAHLALRILDAHSNLIAPTLKLRTLLANNLIAEAFHFVRSKDDIELMKRFFTNCLKMGKLGVIRDLALNEHEGKLVENLLKRIQLPGAENLHFVYLLQKSKYIEAVSYMDELSKGKSTRYGSSTDTNAIDAPNLVISAFNSTMAPVTQSLTDVYFRIRNKIKQKETQNRSPVPLSCQLIKQNANNLLGGIYHSSALSAHFATCYYDEELQYGRRNNNYARQTEISPLSANNAPFLRKPQTETCREAIDLLDRQTISYPQEYKLSDKRRIKDVQNEDAIDMVGSENVQHQKSQQPNKKRRLLDKEFLTGLKHFQQNNIVLDETGLNLTEQVNESFLTQPLKTKQARNDESINQMEDHVPLKTSISNELQGILKSNTPEPTELRTRRGETPANEEKTLRFMLPTFDDQPKYDASKLDVQKETEKAIEPEVKHRVITRSISEESSNEDVDMTPYYTTLSTQDQPNSTTSFQSASIKDSGISLAAKLLDSQVSTATLYQTARCKSLSPKRFGPKPRKPLVRMSEEPEQSSEKQVTLGNKKSTYAKETISSVGISPNKDSDNNGASTSKSKMPPLFKITSITTLSSVEFTPKVCSSKVGEAEKKLVPEPLKMSEQSTVVMTSTSVSDMSLQSSQQTETDAIGFQPRAPLAPILDNKKESIDNAAIPVLDSTLGMSSYDITDFDTTVNEENTNDERQLLEISTHNENIEEKAEETHDETSEQSSEVIELLSSSSSSDEHDVDANENESTVEFETDEDDSVMEVESCDTSEDIGNTDTNNSNETDVAIELEEEQEEEEDDETYTSDSNDIVLQQEDSDVSDSESSKQESHTNSENAATQFSTENTEPSCVNPVQIQEIPNMSTISPAKSEQNLLEEEVNKLDMPEPTSSNSPINKTTIAQAEKQSEEVEEITVPRKDCTEDENPNISFKTDSNLELQNVEYEIKLEETPVEVVPSKKPIEKFDYSCVLNVKVASSKESEKEMWNTEDITLKQSDQTNLGTVTKEVTFKNESKVEISENVTSEKSPIASIEESKDKKDAQDFDTSEHFETPNASFHSIKEVDKHITNIVSPAIEDSPIMHHAESEELQAVDSSVKAEELHSLNSSSNPLQKLRSRGQSLPPQPLFMNEENMETDSQTPKRRSNRGISVPPQTIESVPLIPIGRKRRNSQNTPYSSSQLKTVNEEEGSPQSPTSSRSGRGSQQKSLSLRGSGETPQFDSPALRTRSRMRTISENSDTTVNSLNSPAVSAKKTRRRSISSSISEQLEQTLTPKRIRRASISGQSDTAGTPRSKRLFLKEVEEEPQQTEASNAETDTGTDNYSSTRRLTRTQRALLEKSQHKSVAPDKPKDDQASISSQTSQTSTRSVRQTARSASVKSNDDGDDDRASVTSSVTSETRRSSRRLRAQQQSSPNTNLSLIPEDENVEEETELPSKRNKPVNK